MNGWAQRLVISFAKSNGRAVTSHVSQGSMLGLILFKILIHDLYIVAECPLDKLADGTKL